ncbi:uncharacterized protein LOC141859819 [Acropora palmata]|uniref:uncharacterized protein LOC141859819 n=1 Tax=Acropora palmata TaxID=6131 RepID=UPI003DA134B6
MSETEGRNNAESEAQDRENNALTEGKNEEAEDEGFHEVSTADEEDHIGKEKSAGSKKNPTSRVKEAKSYASSRSSTHTFNKKTQQMVAELQRLKIQMSEFHQSVQRPPVKPFSPDIFNSLSPYYNQYLVNCTIQELLQEHGIPRGYGHKPTALGVVDPEVAWRMDNFPNPVQQSRLPGRLFHATQWSRNAVTSHENRGSTRLPPLPMPSFPRFNQSHYQPNKMTYDELTDFRQDLGHTYKRKAERQAKVDYERTVQDWHRMNLVELKKLPPSPRYHIKKAIVSYLGTTPGSSRALAPLTKALSAGTPEPISQP